MIKLLLAILIVTNVMTEDLKLNQIMSDEYLANKTMQGNVVQALEASVNSYPHAVMLRFKLNRPQLCGASLILAQIVLTAGSCTAEFHNTGGETIAYLGHDVPRYAKVIRRVVNFKLHPKYNAHKMINNLALMFLEKPVEFGKTVKKITFPGREGFGDMIGFGVGWGRQDTHSPVSNVMFRELKGTKQRLLNVDECNKKTGLRLFGHQTYCGFPLYGQFYKDDAGAGVVFKGKTRIFLGAVLSHIVDVVAVHTYTDPTWMKKPAYEMYKESCGIKDHRRRTKRQAESCADFNITELTDL